MPSSFPTAFSQVSPSFVFLRFKPILLKNGHQPACRFVGPSSPAAPRLKSSNSKAERHAPERRSFQLMSCQCSSESLYPLSPAHSVESWLFSDCYRSRLRRQDALHHGRVPAASPVPTQGANHRPAQLSCSQCTLGWRAASLENQEAAFTVRGHLTGGGFHGGSAHSVEAASARVGSKQPRPRQVPDDVRQGHQRAL